MYKRQGLGIITIGLEPYVLVLARAVYFVVALPLVVAALDRFLSAEYASETEPSAEGDRAAESVTAGQE